MGWLATASHPIAVPAFGQAVKNPEDVVMLGRCHQTARQEEVARNEGD